MAFSALRRRLGMLGLPLHPIKLDWRFAVSAPCSGDYPELDFRPHPCLRWLRQAGAVLLFLAWDSDSWADTYASGDDIAKWEAVIELFCYLGILILLPTMIFVLWRMLVHLRDLSKELTRFDRNNRNRE